MYESFYKLKAEPFRLSPDHRFCFSHKSYSKAKAYMQYAIHRAEGFVMVTGKPGTGKTTLVNDLVDGLSQSKIEVATIVSTQLEADDLLRLVAYNFGLDVNAPNKAMVLQGLSVRLRRYHEEGTRALLIIDEAQDLTVSALEELRLLTNLQLNNQPLLQIFLVGQESLRDLIQQPSMEQVHQRLVAACHLESLNEEDTKAYIKHRLVRVGWNGDPRIDEGVYTLIYQFSNGIPRRINLICSRILLHGSVEESHCIHTVDVRAVVQELQYEQLAPIGFTTELPPLPNRDETQDAKYKLPAVESKSTSEKVVKPEVNETAIHLAATTKAEGLITTLEGGAASEVIPEQSSEETSSLGEQVTREGGVLGGQSEDPELDFIHENYFSLSDSVESAPEPVPIRKSVTPAYSDRRYGDRFANAQRAKQKRADGTHYYSELQTTSDTPSVGQRKQGMVRRMLLFLLLVGTVLSVTYLFRSQILQGEISYVEGRLRDYTEKISDSLGGTQNRPLPTKSVIHETSPPIASGDPVGRKKGGGGDGLTLSFNRSHQPLNESVSVPGITQEAALGRIVESQVKSDEEVTTGSVNEQKKQRADPVGNTQVTDKYAFDEMPQGVEPSVKFPTKIPTINEDTVVLSSPTLPTKSVDDTANRSTSEQIIQYGIDKVSPLIKDERSMAEVGALSLLSASDSTVEEVAIGSDLSNVVSTISSTGIGKAKTAHSERGNIDKPGLLLRLSQKRGGGDNPIGQTGMADSAKPDSRILFASDSAIIEKEYQDRLDKIVLWLQHASGDKAHIIGYADGLGDAQYNEQLSVKRAMAVAAYLEARAIDSTRLRIEGRGVYPISKDKSGSKKVERKMQRCVDVIILPSNN